jgi:hypothetical protein
MTPEEQALADAVELFKRLGTPFMLTGSVATSYHGRPCATHDADVVIDPAPEQLEAAVAALAARGFYVDPEIARRALSDRTQFNVIETRYASKIGLIMRRDRPLSVEEFRRRISVDLSFASEVSIVTAEDAILSKLEWARRAGDSERQLADAAGVVAVNPSIDRTYIDHWSQILGVDDLWDRIRGAEGPPSSSPTGAETT